MSIHASRSNITTPTCTPAWRAARATKATQQRFNRLPCEAGGPSGAQGHNHRSSLADFVHQEFYTLSRPQHMTVTELRVPATMIGAAASAINEAQRLLR